MLTSNIEIVNVAMNFLHFFDMQVALHREPRIYKSRLDPMSLSDREFKSHFRFNKDTVCKLVDHMRPDLEHETNRGLPLSPELKLCLALATYMVVDIFNV